MKKFKMKKYLLLLCAIVLSAVETTVSQIPQLWGTTAEGGGAPNNGGVIFRVNGDGSGYVNLHSFLTPVGSSSHSGLIRANNGKLYGTTEFGGAFSGGVIFSFDPVSNTYTDVFDFNGGGGTAPTNDLMQASNGLLYGMAWNGGTYGGGTLFQFNTSNNVFTKLLDFIPNSLAGAYPRGTLVQATNGKLYGMTTNGGILNFGVIFSYDIITNTYTDLYHFNGTDGGQPYNDLFQASNGVLYGTTWEGGLYNCGSSPYDCGTIFCFNTATGTYTKLLDFNGTNGRAPYGTFIEPIIGKLYGTASAGGLNDQGILFSIDLSNNAFTKLIDMGTTDCITPQHTFLKALDGKLYSMSMNGGLYGRGTIFRYDILTNSVTKIHDFDSLSGWYELGGRLIELLPTGIPESLSVQNHITISPLGRKVFSIKYSLLPSDQPGEIGIFDLYGQKVKTIKLEHANGSLQISLHQLSPGIYFCSLTTHKGITSKKIILTN